MCPDDLVERTILRLNNAASSSTNRLEQLLAGEQKRSIRSQPWYWLGMARKLATAAGMPAASGACSARPLPRCTVPGTAKLDSVAVAAEASPPIPDAIATKRVRVAAARNAPHFCVRAPITESSLAPARRRLLNEPELTSLRATIDRIRAPLQFRQCAVIVDELLEAIIAAPLPTSPKRV